MKRSREKRFARWHRRSGVLCVVLGVLRGAAAPAHAAPAPPSSASGNTAGDLQALLDEPVVTTASKSAESASTAPAQILNITAEDIRAFGIRTVDEALNYLSVGVYAAHTAEIINSFGVTTEVGTRGVMFRDGGSRVLVLLDGHTTNSQLDGRSWVNGGLGVPIEAIDHIEVILGPGSVMYGSNALLGVVNVVTRRARDLPGVAATAQVILSPPQAHNGSLIPVGNGDSLGAVYRLSLGLAREFTVLGRRGEIAGQAEWIFGREGSLRFGPVYGSVPQGVFPLPAGSWQGTVVNTVNAPAAVLTARLGDFRLALHLNSSYRNAPFAGGLGISTEDTYTEDRYFGLDLSHRATLSTRVSLSSRLYADVSEESTYQALNGDSGPEFAYGVILRTQRLSQWLGLEEQATVDWRLDGRLTTTLGFDVRGRRSQAVDIADQDPVSHIDSQVNPRDYVNSITALGGVYAQQVYQPLSWLGVNAGLRLDLDQLFGTHFSPRAAVVFTPKAGTAIKLLYTEAFRAPTPEEVYGGSPYTRIAPPSLLAEVVRSIEMEISQRWSGGRAVLNGFVSFYEDMVSDRPATQAEYTAALAAGRASNTTPAVGFSVYDNLGTMQGYGGSLSLSQRLPLHVTAALNVLISHTDVSSRQGAPQPMLFTPSVFGNARLLWQPLQQAGPSLGLSVQVLGPRTPYFGNFVGSQAVQMPSSADFRLTGSLPVAALPGLSLRLIGDYNTSASAPEIIGGPAPLAPNAPALFVPLSRAFLLVEIRYEH